MSITVFIKGRPDGGVHVWSDDLPGLVLSGRERTKVIAAIEPAAIAILKHKGVDISGLLLIDAVFVSPQDREDVPHG